MTGFALLQELKYKDFHLVFTTVQERYVICAFKHQAFDYLLKPFDIDELKQTTQKISEACSGIMFPI